VIQVTLNFPDESALVAFFSNKKAMVTALPEKPATSMVERAKVDQKAEAPAAEKPAGKPAAAPTPAAEAKTSTAPASTVVEYKSLQQAVFKLAGKNRQAAVDLTTELGVPNFKIYEAEDKAGERAGALAKVNAKLAELGA
jgi:hypothetical protein